MVELNETELDLVDGGSLQGAAVVCGVIVVGAAVGVLAAPLIGAGVAAGAVGGALSAGIHAVALWNATN